MRNFLRPPYEQSTRAGVGAVFLAVGAMAGVGLLRDLHGQGERLQVTHHKADLLVQGELELGHAVQDFKDCLLREDAGYCDGFYRHIAAVEKNAAAYRAQEATTVDERMALAALEEDLGTYRASLDEVLAMQH